MLSTATGFPQQEPAGAQAEGDRRMAAFDTAGAIAAYRMGLQRDSTHVGLLLALARALQNLAEETPGTEGDQARFAEAVSLARRGVAIAPDDALAHATLAAALGRYALFQGGRRKVEIGREVREEALRAIQLDPGLFSGWAIIGIWNREVATLNPLLRVFARTFYGGLPPASLSQSEAALRRATRLAPDHILPHLELARTYLALHREREAAAELDRAIALPPREQLDRVLQDQARALRVQIR